MISYHLMLSVRPSPKKRSFTKYAGLNVTREVAQQYIDSIKEYNKKNAPQQEDGLTDKDYLRMMEELRRKKR